MITDIIHDAFSNIGYTPRKGQIEAVESVVKAFVNEGFSNVILSADTGTGKSIIALAVSETLRLLERSRNAIILMHTNGLVDQYRKMADDIGNKDYIHCIKGAVQYDCEMLTEVVGYDVKADSCIYPDMQSDSCKECEYLISKSYINKTANLCTNYSYYFISALWSSHLDPRDLVVFDEAHVLNDTFASHCAIHVSAKRIDQAIKDAEKFGKSLNDEIFILRETKKLVLKKGGINNNNYLKILGYLSKVYGRLKNEYAQIGKRSANTKENLKNRGIAKKYEGYACKIGDLFEHRYEHVLDTKDDEFTVTPVFVGALSEVLLGEYNLFMSGTISEDLMHSTLDLDKKRTKFIKLPPVFEAERKSILKMNTGWMNYSWMQKPENMKLLYSHINQICDAHDGESGLILVPSFYLGKQIAQRISSDHDVFLHESGMNITMLANKFKKKPGSILISHSIFEGFDFKDDSSRFQIIVKAPYPSLGDERIKFIANNHKDVYSMMTLNKIVQGIGRSIRSPDDWAKTYFLDNNINTLFTGKFNIWRGQFHELN